MRTFSPALFLAAAGPASFASAAPVEEQTGDIFTVQQTPKSSVKSGVLSMADAFVKYRQEVPAYLADAVQRYGNANADLNLTNRASTGSASATPEVGDYEYLTPVSIGTPAQPLTLDFDTGSADLWVYSTALAQNLQNGHGVYNPAASKTSKLLPGYNWSITYADGSSAAGGVYTDVVNIGGVSFPSQAVEAANTISNQFAQDTNNDGLVGLAFNTLNTVTQNGNSAQQKTFFDNVKSSLKQPLFAADLKHSKPGSYDFGFADTKKYTGSVAYTNVDNSQGFWGFTSASYKVGNKVFKTKTTGIADTGTTLLLLPDTVVASYYAQVTGAQKVDSYGGWVFPCSANLPSFTYTIAGSTSATGSSSTTVNIVIPGSYFNYSPVGDASNNCYGGMQSSAGIGFNIFGDMALKAAYVVFYGGSTPKVGFAAKTLS